MRHFTNRQTERKYSGSYEQIAKVLSACSSYAGEDTERHMALLLFCFIVGNSDMHLKNFSLIREHDGEWRLSKACESMRFTPVQFKRTVKRVTTNVAAHLEEAFGRSFLSDGFKSRCRVLVRERLDLFASAHERSA